MIQVIWDVLLELAPWLFLGTLIAGLLHVALPVGLVRRNLRGPRGVAQAVALGVPLPLCSCSVIPAGVGLKKDGASDGAAIGFLISTPQTGIDSVMVSAGLLGWPFAIFKVVSAAVTGIVGGLWAERSSPPSPATEQLADSYEHQSAGGLARAFHHGLEILHSIWVWLLVGVVVSAAITVLLPSTWIEPINASGGTLLAALVALLISLPMYVCAISSVPIAGALVAKGLPVGAAMVFLMAGPATNVATIGAIYRAFGKRVLGIYLTTVIVGSVSFALAFDWLVPAAELGAAVAEHEHASWWSATCAVLLLGTFAWFAVDDLRGMWRKRMGSPVTSGPGYRVAIEGMTCDRCAQRLESTLYKTPGVESASVDYESAEAIVCGVIDQPRLCERIAEAGFQSGDVEVIES